MNNNTIIQLLVGFLLSVTLALGGWSLKQHFETNAKLSQMTVTLQQIQDNTTWQNKKDETDRMHWKYLSWAREHIDKLYNELDMELPEKPDLD